MGLALHVEFIKYLFKEYFSKTKSNRIPEPQLIMDNPESVLAFHEQGSHEKGPLLPIYHLNAVMISRMMPFRGRVLDLGCGSGQFLRYLLKLRPDIYAVGYDLSREMITLGNSILRRTGLESRATLFLADMTNFFNLIDFHVDLICSIFSVHHLPSEKLLMKMLEEIGMAVNKFNCSVLIFDHARPRFKRTAELFPEIFTPNAPVFFKKDSCNSLLASFSYEEMIECIEKIFKEKWLHKRSIIFPFYQMHCYKGEKSRSSQKIKITFSPKTSFKTWANYLAVKFLLTFG